MNIPSDPADDEPDQQSLFTPSLIALLVIGLAHGFAFSTFFLLPKYLTTELGAGPELIGRITAVAGVAGVLSVPLVGTLIDRGGRRRLIAIGCALLALGSLGFVWVDSVSLSVFLLRALQGLGATVVFNTVTTLAADLAPPKRLGQTIGIIGVAAVCMNAIAPAIAEPLAHRAGWKPVFALASAAAVLAGLLAMGLRERRVTPAAMRSYRHLRSGRSLAVFYVSAVSGGAFGTLMTFVPAFAIALGARAVSTFFITYTVAVITIRLLLGSVADRWGRQRVALLALGLYGTATFLAAFLGATGLELLGGLFGIAHGFFYPALNAFAVEEVRPEHRGSVMTFFNGSFNAGFAASVVALGAVAQYAGYETAFVTMAALTATALVTLVLIPAAEPEKHAEIDPPPPSQPGIVGGC
jgi:MFS family permease